MIHPNSIAGVCLGAVLVLTALSVPAVHRDTPVRVPRTVVAPVRTLDTLSRVVDTQRSEACAFHEDAQRVAAMVEQTAPVAPVGTVPPRRAPTRPLPENHHGGRP